MAASPRKPATRRAGTIPKEVWSVLGPIPVRRSTIGLDESDLGSFDQHERIITIRPELEKQTAQVTLYHEWIHALLWDSGVTNILGKETEEAVCDAIAAALVASR